MQTSTVQFLWALFEPYGNIGNRLSLEIRLRRVDNGSGPSVWYPLTRSGLAAASRYAIRAGRLDSGWHCGFGVLPRLGHTRGDRNVAAVGALFADVDGSGTGQAGAEVLMRTAIRERRVPAPHIAIGTGGGLHCYWLLERPVALEGENGDCWFRQLQRRLVRAIGADSTDPGSGGAHADLSAINPERLLRPPGTFNNKPARRVPVVIRRFRPEVLRRSVRWWEAFLPHLPTLQPVRASRPLDLQRGLPRWVVAWATTPAMEGDRNRELTRVAARLRRDYGRDRALVRSVLELKAGACEPPYPFTELEEIVRWA